MAATASPGWAREATPAPVPATSHGAYDVIALRPVLPAVVRIEVIRTNPSNGRLQKVRSFGSGTIIDPEGHVLTNYHVAHDGVRYMCHLINGEKLEARLVGNDPISDLAVLQIDVTQRPAGAPPLTFAHFGSSENLSVGDPVFAAGSPLSADTSLTRGVIANASMGVPTAMGGGLQMAGEDVGTVVRWIMHDALIAPGNSGGPLFNVAGEIIGVNEISMALGGAIPGTLAARVARELIAHGSVTRGWSGITGQKRLDSAAVRQGITVAAVYPGSPAALAGIRPGDHISGCNGIDLPVPEELALLDFYRAEMNRSPGSTILYTLHRGDKTQMVELRLTPREPARYPMCELRPWGIVGTRLSRQTIQQNTLPDTEGVLIVSVGGGGAAGVAEPALKEGDVIRAINGQSLHDVDQLRTLTAQALSDTNATKTIRVSVLRQGSLLDSAVTLGIGTAAATVLQADKAWIGIVTQPLLPPLAKQLGVGSENALRITQVFPRSTAATAGLQTGDIVVAIDDQPLSRPTVTTPADIIPRQLANRPAGSMVKLCCLRHDTRLDFNVPLEPRPRTGEEQPQYEDSLCEYTVRNLAHEDRLKLAAPTDLDGLFVEKVIPSGWAALEGLREGDLVLAANGAPVSSVAEFQKLRAEVQLTGAKRWTLLTWRAGATRLHEISLKNINS